MLTEARQTWLDLNRPLDAAGCDLIKGMLLRESNPTEAQKAFDAALSALVTLDVPHMTERARSKGETMRYGVAAKKAQ
jgi:hypothetical protein